MIKEIQIAPMLDWTDTFFRQFFRLISNHATLYTEMTAEKAIFYGNADKLLNFSLTEQPLILQVGGSTPNLMAKVAKIATNKGFKGININAGCPSERVFAGAFGACLMAEPDKVAECIKAMKCETNLPISVKTRIALDTPNDTSDGFDSCCRFVEKNASAGADTFIIHARKARLKGLTPKENRQKLPLNYPLVYRIKEIFPELNIIINGQILNLDEVNMHLKYVDGVMIGRWAYAAPYELKDIDKLYYNDSHSVLLRFDIVQKLLPLISTYPKPLNATRHLMGLYAKTPLSKAWKQILLKNNINDIEDFLQKNSDF